MILHCPECHAEWPEFLQHEHDMLEVDSFAVGDDGEWLIVREQPEYLDHREFHCTACLNVVVESAEGEELDGLYESLLEAMPAPSPLPLPVPDGWELQEIKPQRDDNNAWRWVAVAVYTTGPDRYPGLVTRNFRHGIADDHIAALNALVREIESNPWRAN